MTSTTQCRDCGREYTDLTRAERRAMRALRGCPSDDCTRKWTQAERDANATPVSNPR